MSMMVSFCAVFFPRGVLDEILNLIESVSEGFPSYFFLFRMKLYFAKQWKRFHFLINLYCSFFVNKSQNILLRNQIIL